MGWQDRGVTEPTPRLVRRIRADFAPGTAEEVVRRLRALPGQWFGGQDAERIHAALVFQSGGSWSQFVEGLGLLEQDWRDVLVNGGMADQDWPMVLAQELGDRSARSQFGRAAHPRHERTSRGRRQTRPAVHRS